ncbi:glycosyl hydrolase family 28-related protein [Niveispirillum sp. BGYR6]|uniref:rhamnogalacturonidase n=1 Tax=Niveispirillum sp. BGYR6 TaxID=2971249 RepID=UPI0022B994F7|nr:glycosyl hydrolase family 28-related protein [Niveispirillum sp. BGYR6]MDG5496347.1 glycosyl hydrolase family 28-related protein [Niveispirillum sp. BGYR6]
MSPLFDIRHFGAVGDGVALDSPAINRTIAAAVAAGGGTVWLPAGRWLSFSIRLYSRVALHLDAGCVLLAADPARHGGAYDLPEPNPHDLYQDFGHSHWQNSLIWGDGVNDVAITGPGLIDGAGLTSKGPGAKWAKRKGYFPESMAGMSAAELAAEDPDEALMRGLGNKAIALKNCRNITLRDFSIFKGGHFAILATGTDNLTIDNLRIDTDRDGIDLDAVRHVRVSNCQINTPNDDALVLKSSGALGVARATEHVAISNCHVSGFDLGTLLDGTYGRTQQLSPDRDRVTGRIKLGTESHGGFRNIVISNCTIERSRGLALETVDGGVLEDISISNITMREVTTAALFLRIGARLRAPEGTKPGPMRRIRFAHITAHDVDPRYASLIAGLPEQPVEEVTLQDIRITYAGGLDAVADPVPEKPDAYPEPSMFGTLPSYGLYVRHARGLHLRDIHLSTLSPDGRPAVWLEDVDGVRIDNLQTRNAMPTPRLVCRDVRGLTDDEGETP